MPDKNQTLPDWPSVQSTASGWLTVPGLGSTTGLDGTFGCSSVHCHCAADHCE